MTFTGNFTTELLIYVRRITMIDFHLWARFLKTKGFSGMPIFKVPSSGTTPYIKRGIFTYLGWIDIDRDFHQKGSWKRCLPNEWKPEKEYRYGDEIGVFLSIHRSEKLFYMRGSMLRQVKDLGHPPMYRVCAKLPVLSSHHYACL